MKYARKDNTGHWIDVYTVPGQFPDLATLEKMLGVTGFEVVPDGVEPGATDNGNGSYTNPQVPTPAPVPIIMTDKQFRKYAAQQLGSSAAVGAIYTAAQTSNDADVKFAFMAWSKAQTYEKAEVSALCTALVAGSCMTSQQRTALLANWPEA